MILSFHPCLTADHQIIMGDRYLNHYDLAYLEDAEAILLPQACSEELYEICRAVEARLFPEYHFRFTHPGKLGMARFFEAFSLPHPDSMVWPSVAACRNTCGRIRNFPHKVPFVIKADHIHESGGVFLIPDQSSLDWTLGHLEKMERTGSKGFLSQEYIDSEGSVLRVVIMGSRTITFWKRPDRAGGVITGIGKGAKIDRKWRPDLQKKGVDWATVLRRRTGMNLAALDCVFSLKDPDPRLFFLEIHYSFGRRGLGGTLAFYELLLEAAREWLGNQGFDPNGITLS